jgi:hypothetical protein
MDEERRRAARLAPGTCGAVRAPSAAHQNEIGGDGADLAVVVGNKIRVYPVQPGPPRVPEHRVVPHRAPGANLSPVKLPSIV